MHWIELAGVIHFPNSIYSVIFIQLVSLAFRSFMIIESVTFSLNMAIVLSKHVNQILLMIGAAFLFDLRFEVKPVESYIFAELINRKSFTQRFYSMLCFAVKFPVNI